jgi:hypothetical protein
MLHVGMRVKRKLDVGSGSREWWEKLKREKKYKDDTVFTVHKISLHGISIYLLDANGYILEANVSNWVPITVTTSLEDWL